MHDRVLAGLELITMVLGVDLALAWRDTSALYVLGGVLLGGLAGEALRIEDRIAALGDRLQAMTAGSRRLDRQRGVLHRASSSASARSPWSARSRTA